MRSVVMPWFGALVSLTGCAGVSTDPEVMAARELDLAAPDVDTAAVAADEVLALHQMQSGNPAAALETARDVLARDPRRARARAVLALSLLLASEERDPAPMAIESEADGESLTAVRIAPADPVVGLLRARVLAEIGHVSAAAAAAEECLAAAAATDFPEFVDLLAAAAEWTHELGEDRRALVHLRELSSRRPTDATTYYRLGTCLLRIATNGDDAEAASRAFARCVELEPDREDAHAAVVAALVRAAEIYEREGESDSAKAQLTAARDAASVGQARFLNSATAAFRTAAVCELQGDWKQAVAEYDTALRRDPEHLPSLLNLLSCAVGANAAYAELCTANPQLPSPASLIDRALAVDAAVGGLSSRERQKLETLRAAGR